MLLNETLVKRFKEAYDKLNASGKLVPKARLDEYHKTFEQNFGPEQLKQLDGVALLEKMHDHSSVNRDSLVYWLEFKDDDELPAIFGSIAGGSALKFGIYKRKENGIWMTGSPQKQQELSLEEAVDYARKHRDQLIRGAALLEKLPHQATDEDYRALQQQMEAEAPDVSDTAWGHKYFYMLYPDKLIDYHVSHYQRFYLYKLQQVPPRGEGRYLTDGRFITVANELGIPGKHLSVILGNLFGRPH
ncbi:MAG: AAA family ATPase, partial [Thermoanaerobacteraceae bacterium]|nr:AAA family ATPase [Thermoanaerobacteraceae bacterium]